MKKLFAILSALILLLSLAACTKEPPIETTKPAQSTTAPQQTQPTQTNAPGDAGTTLEAGLWTLSYDPKIWVFDEEEDYYYDDEYASIYMFIPNGSDSYSVSVELSVSIDDAEDFRDALYANGFDDYEYAVNNAYESENIGGIDCLVHEGSYWGEDSLRYIGRVEAAAVTVQLEILGNCEDPRVEALLQGLTIVSTDIGNVDFPWPWDGEPFYAPDASVAVGKYSMNSRWLPFSDGIITRDTFDHSAAIVGNTVYILGDSLLKLYTYDGSTLEYADQIALDGDYEYIQAAKDGTLWLSAFMEPVICIKDGQQTAVYDGPDNFTVHPSGQWGISWFTGPDCQKVTFSGGSAAYTDISFPEVSAISTLLMDDKYIYVCGYGADESGHKVYIYDLEGKLQMVLTDEEGENLGSVTFIARSANGFLGLDGNMRDVLLWAPDGAFIGVFSDGDVFNTYYPWFCGGAVFEDGSFLAIMTEDREDQSAMELIAYQLSGF